jgi:YHS domain-containing protein
MTRTIVLAFAAMALVALLIGCGQKEEQAQVEETAGDVQVASAKVVDPVCGMEVDPKTAVTAEHMGQSYHFCSAQCQDQFLQDPAKYIKSQGMVDPVCGMKIDPKTAVTAEYEGKMYHFCSAECHEKFMQDPEKYMSPEAHHVEGEMQEGHGH